MIVGTYNFRSKATAISYYGDAREVEDALKEERIFIGPPKRLAEGERLVFIDGGLRYGIENGLKFREGDTIKGIYGRARLVFSQISPISGEIFYTRKPWLAFWKGTATNAFSNIEEAQVYFKNKPSPDFLDPEQIKKLLER